MGTNLEYKACKYFTQHDGKITQFVRDLENENELPSKYQKHCNILRNENIISNCYDYHHTERSRT